MTNLGIKYPSAFFEKAEQERSTISQGLTTLMPHTKYYLNRNGSLREEDVLVPIAEIRLPPFTSFTEEHQDMLQSPQN